MQKGSIRVQTENIFPIIKKFLYSEHDIFIRELVSNAVDATQKLKTLSSIKSSAVNFLTLTSDKHLLHNTVLGNNSALQQFDFLIFFSFSFLFVLSYSFVSQC